MTLRYNKVRGGSKFKAFVRNTRRAQAQSAGVEVGFFSTAKYADGTHVAAVAAWNEFGTRDGRVPERPFFRNAIRGANEDLVPVLVEHIDPKSMAMTPQIADKVGFAMVGRIQRSITVLRAPPNAPITIKGGWMRSKTGKPIYIKGKGSSNPLRNTGFMTNSVGHRVK